ncbi:MAG: ImmA/IrrE family metallo-endopeptidase [Bacilli bacterium]|nr:ImmA/IrrE family metallo-endopeptidase [Bacilli bacterium]
MTEKGKENLDNALKMLEDGVRDVFESNKFQEVLDTMSKFHSYSMNNIILIESQRPTATNVAGFSTWKKLGRNVIKGESGIQILAPVPRKYDVEVEKTDKDGNVTKEIEQKEYMSFRVAYVFDIEQTEGKELTLDITKTLDRENPNYEMLYDTLKQITDCKVIEEDTGKANGYFNKVDNVIAVKKDNPLEQKIKTIIHEIAHSKLHNTPEASFMDSKHKEIEAEATAYVVCNYLGIDSSDYSFGYVVGWSRDKESDYLKSVLDKIKDVSNEIIDLTEDKYKELNKEQSHSIADMIKNAKEKYETLKTDIKEPSLDKGLAL